jgi:hypothetical protein
VMSVEELAKRPQIASLSPRTARCPSRGRDGRRGPRPNACACS